MGKTNFLRIPNARGENTALGIDTAPPDGGATSFPPLTWPMDHTTQQTLRRWLDGLTSGVKGGPFGSPFITGKITTSNSTPTSAVLASIPVGTAAFVSAYITAKDSVHGYFASFVRNGAIKNVGGTLAFFDVLQDSFTMREQDWSVDFYKNNSQLLIRVYGISSQVIQWNYAALVFPTS